MTRWLDMLRVVLGAAVVLGALQYFLPSLVPVVPAPAWDDPMAVRLMGALDRSGLLAVARFIQLAAGALLLSNRAVPFALAALLPVNVCALFIALFIEGEPALAVVALLTVAANALLMLAYLPWYRGVLEGGQLADGEGPEPGHNFESLFVNPFGATPAAAYPGAALVLIAAVAFYGFVVPYANGTTGLIALAVPAVLLAAGWLRALGRGRKA